MAPVDWDELRAKSETDNRDVDLVLAHDDAPCSRSTRRSAAGHLHRGAVRQVGPITGSRPPPPSGLRFGVDLPPLRLTFLVQSPLTVKRGPAPGAVRSSGRPNHNSDVLCRQTS